MDAYYDYEVESAYMPAYDDYQDWTEHLRAVEEES